MIWRDHPAKVASFRVQHSATTGMPALLRRHRQGKHQEGMDRIEEAIMNLK